jgi:hypothetical protein
METIKKLCKRNKNLPLLDNTYCIKNGYVYVDTLGYQVYQKTSSTEEGVFSAGVKLNFSVDEYPELNLLPSDAKKLGVLTTNDLKFIEYYSSISNTKSLKTLYYSILFKEGTILITNSSVLVVREGCQFADEFSVHIDELKSFLKLPIDKEVEIFKTEKRIFLKLNEIVFSCYEQGVKMPVYDSYLSKSKYYKQKITLPIKQIIKRANELKSIGKFNVVYYDIYKKECYLQNSDHTETLPIKVEEVNITEELLGVIMPIIGPEERIGISLDLLKKCKVDTIYFDEYEKPFLFEPLNFTNMETKKQQETKQQETKKQETKQPKKSTKEVDLPTKKELVLIDYSEKSFAIFGETKKHKGKLKEFKAKFNPFLNFEGGKKPGWVISKKNADCINYVKKFI